jgi:hypothetical protein
LIRPTHPELDHCAKPLNFESEAGSLDTHDFTITPEGTFMWPYRIPRIGRAAGLLLCGAAGACDLTSGPSNPVDELSISVSTKEWEDGRSILLVGETGSVRIFARRGGVAVDAAAVRIRSLDDAVVRIDDSRRDDTRLIGVAPGSTSVIATVDGVSATRRVDVVSERLPITGLSIRVAKSYSTAEWSTGIVRYGDDGSLESVRISTYQWIPPVLVIERDGATVMLTGDFSILSSHGSIALVRPPGCSTAPHWLWGCSILDYNHWGWIEGRAAGVAEITVRVRNLSRTFEVIVE